MAAFIKSNFIDSLFTESSIQNKKNIEKLREMRKEIKKKDKV